MTPQHWLSDRVLRHLQDVAAEPDLSATRYRLLQVLGRGGMGVVYLAEDKELLRNVALKVLNPAESSPEMEERLLAEARILARLEHPGIVPVHDAGRLPDGRVYYVMKSVEGETLDVYLRHPLTLPQRLRLFERICETVAFAHARKVIHRDLKPGNIMVGSFGEVLVMDWGVARVENQPDSNATEGVTPGTGYGTVVGTPGYMAPEQAAGGTTDERADIYALGRMLLEATGAAPPKPLEAIFRKAQADQPEERYVSVEALAEDIGRYLERARVSAHRETLLERLGRLGRRHRTAILVILAYLIMRVALFFWTRR